MVTLRASLFPFEITCSERRDDWKREKEGWCCGIMVLVSNLFLPYQPRLCESRHAARSWGQSVRRQRRVRTVTLRHLLWHALCRLSSVRHANCPGSAVMEKAQLPRHEKDGEGENEPTCNCWKEWWTSIQKRLHFPTRSAQIPLKEPNSKADWPRRLSHLLYEITTAISKCSSKKKFQWQTGVMPILGTY